VNCDLRVARHAGNPVSLPWVTRKNELINAVFLNPNIRRFDRSGGAIFSGDRRADVEAVGEDFLQLDG